MQNLNATVIAGRNENPKASILNYFTARFPEAKIKVKRHYYNYQVRLRQGRRNLRAVVYSSPEPVAEYFARELEMFV